MGILTTQIAAPAIQSLFGDGNIMPPIQVRQGLLLEVYDNALMGDLHKRIGQALGVDD